jgi:hypothetical protein
MITKLNAAVALGYDATLRQNELYFDVDHPPTEAEIQTKLAELEAAEPLRLLREKRNQLLAQSDWRMVSDYPGTNQTEWQTYRQALRDITTQTPSLDSDGNLTGITWPTPPTD